MRTINYSQTIDSLLTKNIVNLVSAIHEYRGKQSLFISAQPDILNKLLEVAKIQSTQSSNQIEGIYTSDKRLKEIVALKSEPRNRNESEIAGYRDVLDLIHDSYDFMNLSPNLILQLHRDLYKYSPSSIGGKYKNADNIIAEIRSDGTEFVRFKPVSAFETASAIELICDRYNQEIKEVDSNPLILIPVFILDFLCIHPFNDGNGRMSRLLTLLLLYQNDYIVGKYISIEMLIEKNKEGYYETLHQSSINWKESENDYTAFVEYYLTIILNAYKEFSNRVEYLASAKISKSERIELLFKDSFQKISKQDIINKYPDISKITIERTLSRLLEEGKIIKLGAGKNTKYIKK